MKQKNGIGLKELIVIVVIASIFTSITTGVIMYNNNRITSHVSGNDLNQDEDLKEFIKVYASLVGDYYTDINKKEMLEKAIASMFEYLGEDYSDYLSRDETDALAEKLKGEYKGIGVQIINDNIIYRVFSDSPAKEAGLMEGDKIISVNGENVDGKNSNEVSSKIQSSLEEKLTIGILRDGETKTFTVEVKTLFVPATDYQLISLENHKIGYLAISTFSNTVSTQVKHDLEEMESQGMDRLILDLRGNTGGYLVAATEVAKLFLEKEQLIYSLTDKNETKQYKDDTDEKRNYKILVLINEGTASASEILAAALKDSYGATLLGETSYGKGKVQQTKNLEDGTMVKYTTARWLRPNGDCIDGVGLVPDIEVVLEWNPDGGETIDTQLKEAIRIMSEE